MLALQDSLAALKHWRSWDGGIPCWHRVGGDRWCLKELIPHPAVLLVSAMLLLGAGTSSCFWDTQLCSGPEHKGVNCAERPLPPPALPLHCTSCV